MNQTCTIKEMLEDERPYEKCLRYGVENLSNAELLAVLLRTGTRGTNSLEMARNILRTSEQEEDNILAVHQLTMEKLKAIKGIGTVKATQILCLSELAKASFEGQCKRKSDFYVSVYNRRLLYGRSASSEAGTHETSDAEYEIKTHW